MRRTRVKSVVAVPSIAFLFLSTACSVGSSSQVKRPPVQRNEMPVVSASDLAESQALQRSGAQHAYRVFTSIPAGARAIPST